MVYDLNYLGETRYEALDTTPPPPPKNVIITYNGSGLHTYAGPTPYINFSRRSNTDDNGYLHSQTIDVNIEGKIVRNGIDTGLIPTGTGIESIMGAMSGLNKIFTDSDGYSNKLEIFCGSDNQNNKNIFTASGVKVVSINFNRTNDGWTQTADYNIQLVYHENVREEDKNKPIKSSTDNWSIEPLEDYFYTQYLETIKAKPEYHNPKMLPLPAPSQNSPTTIAPILQIKSMPRFKITHTVAAVGISISGIGFDSVNECYLNAEKWVRDRASKSFIGASTGNIPYIRNYSTPFPANADMYLYNHLRTSNFSVSAGSYQIVDTWLAMPSAVSFIEDYTIETSTDEKYIKTVKVAGSIEGLSFSNVGSYSGMASGAGYLDKETLDISNSLDSDSYSVNMALSDITTTTNVNIRSEKYLNCQSGWLQQIKPYLYRRACLGMNSSDRNAHYVNPIYNTTASAAKNPTYSYENLLNVIPVSTSETHDPRKGKISYSYEFNNKFTFLSGVISENINVDITGPNDVVAESFVLGRKLGPVIQNLGASTSSKKTARLEIAVVPPSSIGGFLVTNSECPVFTGGRIMDGIRTLFKGLAPFGDRPTNFFGNYDQRTSPQNEGQVYITENTENWNPTEGRFSKTVSWLYQPCSNTRSYLDN